MFLLTRSAMVVSDLDATKHNRQQGVCDQCHGGNADKHANNENRLSHQ
jgi:hypothetical protein